MGLSQALSNGDDGGGDDDIVDCRDDDDDNHGHARELSYRTWLTVL